MSDRPPFDTRPSIRIANTAPEHPKIAGLSDAAFRLWIEVLCWCSRQEKDGLVPESVMKRLGRPRVVTELVKAEVLHEAMGSYLVHDYLEHQRSAEEIASFRASKSESGTKGAHMRWHVPNRKSVADCPFCQEVADA